MKKYGVIALLMVAGMLYAQDAAQSAAPQANNGGVADELRQLRQAIETQQKQIEQQQRQIDALRGQLAQPQEVSTSTANSPRVIDAALHTAMPAKPEAASYGDGQEPEKESPLSFRIGKMDFTPGGYADFTTVFRGTNLGSGIGTSFNALPFNNTVQGHNNDLRLTGQASRLSLKAHGVFGANDVTGYVEADFIGNDAANVFVSANSHTNRLRLYWVDVKHNKWEFMGGQSWSWLTPNREGLSPDPSKVFFTLNEDTNYQVGLTWTRAAQFRVVYHPNQHWAFGLAVENPDQYVGAGEVIYPFQFNALLGPQFDAANQTGVPNVAPDFIPKIAFDTEFMGGRHLHLEAAGLITTMKATSLSFTSCTIPCPPNPFQGHSSTGGGVEFAGNVDILKQWRFVASGFYSNGGGRYIFGLGPDTVVQPIALSPTSFNLDLKLVTAASGIVGFEFPLTDKTTIAAYYGGAYFDREPFQDITSPLLVKPWIGFGGLNSPNSANRALQEGTLDWTQTFWSDRNYGKLQLITQFSYVTRAPWFVPLGAPKNAHTVMGYVGVRYILP